MAKRVILFSIKLLVTAGLFTLLFWPERFGLSPDVFGGVKPKHMLDEIKDAGARNVVFWLGFALVMKLGGMLAALLRWRLLLKGQGLKIPFTYLLQSFFIGRAIGIFLPGTIGLDGYRLLDSSVYTGEVIKCTTVIAIEKLTGIIALALLVFLTFPLGFRLLDINVPVLAGILVVLAMIVTGFMLLLLNPRIIQILVAVLPTPGFVRSKFNKLGAAATAYSGSRMNLLLAVFFALMVHTGTCLMYFGTMSAIRAENTGLLDILFAAPMMIGATVIGPSVGGEGIREIVFVYMLAGTTSAAAAATLAHLGWWVGELVPFLIGLGMLWTRKLPDRAELREARADAAGPSEDYLHLPPDVLEGYRKKIYGCIAAGVCAGLVAGGLVAIAECYWFLKLLPGLTEVQMFTWGPVAYGLIFGCIGLGAAGGLLFVYLLLDRFAPWTVSYMLSVGGIIGVMATAIFMFSYNRDINASHGMTLRERGVVLAYVLGAALIAMVIAYLGAAVAKALTRGKPGALIGLGVLAWIVVVAAGMVLGKQHTPVTEAKAFTPAVTAQGPNIVFIGIDTLRADCLPLYTEDCPIETPGIDAFAEDGVLFERAFSQASWTKPSFATMFTGMYPESHRATTKKALLPEEVDTIAELLQAGGYYTKGFSNNPNTDTLFNFDQGFVDYHDLKPDHGFGAELSSSKMFMYNILRMVKGVAARKLIPLARIPVLGMPFGPIVRMKVEEHYQPADVVTRSGLDWIDSSERPADAPFFLFLHYMDPHDPFMDDDYVEGGYARVRMGGNINPDRYQGPMKAAYYREIEYLDRYLAELFEGLRQRNLFDDTLIVLTADHGEEFYEHEGWWHGTTLYDEQTHIPLVLKLPGNAHGGTRNSDLARHVDLPPTMLHLAGLEKGGRMPGQTLYDRSGVFTNATIGYAYSEVDFENNVVQSVRSKACKLITANEGNPRGLDTTEVYDMAMDPGEETNLAGAVSVEACQEDLSGKMVQYQLVIQQNAAEPVAETAISDELTEQLESLGYVE